MTAGNAVPDSARKAAPKPRKSAAADASPPGPQTAVWTELRHLLVKVGVIALAVWALFTFLYGVYRCGDADMSPALHSGDLVLYYRLDKRYVATDVAVVRYDGRTLAGRVVAVAGDTVDIADGGVVVNGALQQEPGIYASTTQFRGGVAFPLTVGPGQVFLLGDSRTSATDSRIYGCVNTADTLGKIIGLIRRRNL